MRVDNGAITQYLDGLNEVSGSQKPKSNTLQQLCYVLLAIFRIVVDPAGDAIEHYLFVLDVQVIGRDYLHHAIIRQHKQLVAFGSDFSEVFKDEVVSGTFQACAEVGAGEIAYSYAVVPVEAVQKVVAASLDKTEDVKLVGGGQEALHVLPCDGRFTGVGVIDDQTHHVCGHAWYEYLTFVCFVHAVGEEGSKVWATSRHDRSVYSEMAILNTQHDITELAVLSQIIQDIASLHTDATSCRVNSIHIRDIFHVGLASYCRLD